MKRRYFILPFIAALTAALSPCVEAFSYAWQQTNCEQEMSCCMKKQAEDALSSAKKSGSHCGKHSEEEHGQCSSLCHCSCCGHVVTAFYAFIPMLQAAQEFRQKPNYYSSYHFDYTHLIWQPPRLG